MNKIRIYESVLYINKYINKRKALPYRRVPSNKYRRNVGVRKAPFCIYYIIIVKDKNHHWTLKLLHGSFMIKGICTYSKISSPNKTQQLQGKVVHLYLINLLDTTLTKWSVSILGHTCLYDIMRKTCYHFCDVPVKFA